MPDIKPMIRHVDNEPLIENGHRGRFVLPEGRPDACTTRIPAPPRGPFIRDFTLRHGDATAEERRMCAVNPAGARQKAMVGYEQDSNDLRRLTSEIHFSTMLSFFPDPAGQAPIPPQGRPWWEVHIQWNAAPPPGGFWRSPPIAVERLWIKGVEHMGVFVHTDPGVANQNGIKVAACEPFPIQRRQHALKMIVKDGRGGDGLVIADVEGKRVCEYRAPVGYRDYKPMFLGYGDYRSCNSIGQNTTRFEAIVEGVA